MWRYLFAFALFQVAFSLDFYLSFDSDVSNAFIDVPTDAYNGVVNTTVTPLTSQDLLLCINWLVPAEAPMINLSKAWPAVCDFTQSIPREANPQPFTFLSQLRSGVNYYSLTAFDLDSIGVVHVPVEVAIGSCPDNSYGPDCAGYDPIVYSQTYVVDDQPTKQFKLSTNVNSTLYIQNLKFTFGNTLTNASVSYRLSGPPIPGVKTDGVCSDLKQGCVITTPPMTKSNSFWIITVTATNLSFSIAPTPCSSKIGASCNIGMIDGTTLKNSVSQYNGAQYFTFPGPIFDVAVGGLDGYAQTPFAPNMTVQIDNVPTMVLSSGINAQSNRLTINMTGSPLLTDSSVFVVFVDAKGSFGIWIPNENASCPSNCSGRGTCEDYVCQCPTGNKNEYNGLGCEHEVKSFTIEYIILIAVGGLLVLSIVIGVPVYCWMNRHSDYETVA